MLKGRLGLEKARIPHADRHGLLWLSRGELCVIDGCLHFLRGKDSLTPGIDQIPHQAVSMILLGPGSSVTHDALRLLARQGLAIPADHLERDWTQPYVTSPEVEAAWAQVYRDPHTYWDLYQLGEKLTDIEDAFRLWRFRHVTTVERVIGFKRGTGGTGGVSYLRKMLDVVLFPEIWSVRTAL